MAVEHEGDEFWLRCDDCNQTTDSRSMRAAAICMGILEGWYVYGGSNDEAFCPTHGKQRREK